jgi:hygromycin-B 7''-O-kinase
MHSSLKTKLATVDSFEKYEQFKLNVDLLKEIAQAVVSRHQLPVCSLKLFSEGANIVFSYNQEYVIKIYPPMHVDQFKRESLVIQGLIGKLTVKTPNILYQGEITNWPYLIMTQLEGELLETLWEKLDYDNKISIIRELGLLIKEVHALPTNGLEVIDCHWEQFIRQQMHHCIEQHRIKKLSPHLLRQIPDYLEPVQERLKEIKNPVILTGEYTPMNLLVKQIAGVWRINGLIDFGDAMLGLPQYDLLGPGAFLIQGDKRLLREFLVAYGYAENQLTPELSHQLTALMLLHQYSNLGVQIRIEDWENKVTSIQEVEKLVWGF